MIIGAVVEGHGEEAVVRVILGWLGVTKCRVRRAEGVADLRDNARLYSDQLIARGATHILFFLDADEVGIDGRRAGIMAHLNARPATGRQAESIFFFIPKPMLEAWLLADEGGLATVLEVSSVERVSNPEEPGPVQRLDDLFRAHRKTYLKAVHAKAIADASTDRSWSRCDSYARATEPLR